mmetsp:Transcript_11638/g.22318  ORF Transcript_11638/g.22318 Transcript_11638/m.22318 type:complete len:123 (-) Transcript_11638:152-520(-)
MTYYLMLAIFFSSRFQQAVIRMFPGPYYWLYLKLYGSLCLSFVLFVLTHLPNPICSYDGLPAAVKIVFNACVLWWFVASLAIIATFWATSLRVVTPGNLLPLTDLELRQGRCALCALGLCVG